MRPRATSTSSARNRWKRSWKYASERTREGTRLTWRLCEQEGSPAGERRLARLVRLVHELDPGGPGVQPPARGTLGRGRASLCRDPAGQRRPLAPARRALGLPATAAATGSVLLHRHVLQPLLADVGWRRRGQGLVSRWRLRAQAR